MGRTTVRKLGSRYFRATKKDRSKFKMNLGSIVRLFPLESLARLQSKHLPSASTNITYLLLRTSKSDVNGRHVRAILPPPRISLQAEFEL
jgi:hypothetical protein